MIRLKCPHCGAGITAADAHAGKKAKCPGCQGLVVLPTAAASEQAAVKPGPPRPGPPPLPPAPRPAPPPSSRPKPSAEEVEELEPLEEVEEEEAERERPLRGRGSAARRRVEEPEEDEEVEEEKPRKRRKKKRGGGFARCPHCGARDATRLSYTFWGGFLGPLLIHTVRCNDCGTQYNGKHGDYNTVRIAIFVSISLVVGAILGLVGFLAAKKGH
jgi:uncharacterized protein (DUF983 family)/DNA-directed RNA polymerase subunit RPC12/RpoP